MRAIAPGAQLGPYQLTRLIGTGGMGQVFEARDTRLGRTVAVKVSREEFDSRFRREALAIASLNHPNICTLHDVGPDYIVLELVEGETLAERIARGPLAPAEAVRIARDVAEALRAAHQRGVVHRDLKPANIKLTPDGRLKVLDFGLAKLLGHERDAETTTTVVDLPTEAGVVLGTLAYMSPEQAQGQQVDARTDIWSLGVILYEMLSGRSPFAGDTAQARVAAMLSQPVPRAQAVPRELQSIIERATEKDPARRYSRAADAVQALEAVALRLSRQTSPGVVRATARAVRRPGIGIPLVIAVCTAVAWFAWLLHRRSVERRARVELIPRAHALAEAGEYGAAFALASEAARTVPGDPAIAQLWPEVSRELTVRSEPPGAQVSWKPYADRSGAWQPLGATPIAHVRLPAGPLRMRLVSSGFVALEVGSGAGDIDGLLVRAGTGRDGMVHVPTGPLRANYAGLGEIDLAAIEAFDVDAREVTNREFKAFIDAGGYRRRELWTVPFVESGRTLAWDAAMARFVDATGRPGPAAWEGGGYAERTEDEPVRGVSWYEAAAYAQFAGKQLPTVYHWVQAALPDESAHLIPLSNFGSGRVLPAGRSQAVNRHGAIDMAGNVREWCWNERAGQRFIQGGSWADPAYMFARGGTAPPFDRSSTNGFRCAIYGATTGGIELRAPVVPRALPAYLTAPPVSSEVFDVYRSLYAYETTPLDAGIDTVDDSSDLWRRERVRFKAAYGGEQVIAQLFTPRHGRPPYQVVLYFPSGDALRPGSSDTIRPEAYVLRSGRAMVYPVFKPTYERFADVALTPVVMRDGAVTWRKDIGRTLDYLATRRDIDARRVAYMGGSWGAEVGPIMLALEPRFRAAVLQSGGLTPRFGVLPEVNTANFLPRVTTPVLMLNGQFDAILPVAESQDAMFRRLGTPEADKRHVVLATGHWLATETRTTVMREVLDWLDKYLGIP